MKTLPFGTWPSSITADAIVAETVRLSSVTLDGGRIAWLEGRPGEGGRAVLVRTDASGQPEDLTPPPFNVRSAVHEYGGGAYALSGDRWWFSNYADGRVYSQAGARTPAPLTAQGSARFGDLTFDPARRRLLAVRETHRGDTPPVNELVAVSIDDGSETVLAAGQDFYAAPAPSPDGRHLAWLAWDQPDMPWDAAALWLAELDGDGAPRAPTRIIGGSGCSAFQPAWAPDGALWCVADPQGWWNLHRWQGGELRCMHRAEREFGKPLWQLGTTTFGFDARGDVVCTWRAGDGWRLGRLDANGTMHTIALPWTSIDSLSVEGSTAAFIGGAPERSTSVVTVDLESGAARVLRSSSALSIGDELLSRPVALSYPTGDGSETAHGYYYAPRNASCRAAGRRVAPAPRPQPRRPDRSDHRHPEPVDPVLDEPGLRGARRRLPGSTGYGRAYRERLYGEWGVVDVEDCVAGALHLAETGRADPARLAIRGGSAGGYTTLAALTFHDVFRAGASYYGICDLEVLAADTHKFEARYLDRLVGEWPADRDTYRARSPLHHASQLGCPIIFFQGLDDRVVPPNQAELMANELDRQRLPVACLMFEGEGHGFRKAETIRRCLQAELAFYGRVFGFEPADDLPPLDIRNLRHDSGME